MEILYIVTAVCLFIFPESLSSAASAAVSAMKNVVLRSLFPMMVLSRLIASSGIMSRFARLVSKSHIWRLLGISDSLLPAVLMGLFSGLPSSALEVERVVREGGVTPIEAQKALALSSLPSPAFVILAASPSVANGVLRYILLVLTAYLVTLVHPSKRTEGVPSYSPVSFTSAIASSANAAILVSASIAFFAVAVSLASAVFHGLALPFAVFFEMGTAVIHAGGNNIITAIALGWRGLSALCQISSSAPSVSLRIYLKVCFFSAFVLLCGELL